MLWGGQLVFQGVGKTTGSKKPFPQKDIRGLLEKPFIFAVNIRSFLTDPSKTCILEGSVRKSPPNPVNNSKFGGSFLTDP